MKHWTVLKFGGTSVARAGNWNAIARLAEERLAGERRVVLVFSALAGVTNALQALADGGEPSGPIIDGILERHEQLAADLEIDAAAVLREGREAIGKALRRCRSERHPAALAELLAQGEILSSRLGQLFLSRTLDVAWVDARQALPALPEPFGESRRAWLSARSRARPDRELQQRWSALPRLLITQGFIAAAADGSTVLLGRGGSDTSAALLAGRLEAAAVEIWTDVPGLFSADPRHEPAALLIRELDYSEALELAASGARVVHGRAIRAAAEAGIPMLIRDIARPDLPGTRIAGDAADSGQGIKAVTCQNDMLVLLLENLDARQQVGFLAGVFRTVSEAGISVDLVATSETTTTLAISAAANHLARADVRALRQALSRWCRVDLFEDCACVNLVGRGARMALTRMGAAADFFRDRPLLMLSQSANDLSISLLVHSSDAVLLVARLHAAMIERDAAGTGCFGPAWQSLGAHP